MAEPDPYLVLGVARTASREEIARAYRRLAKQHHPDAGAPPSRQMARINDAWFILSDRTRRARWDADHTVALAPHWAGPAPTTRRAESVRWEPPPFSTPRTSTRPPPPPPSAPASVRESPWFAVVVAAGIVALIGVVMVGVGVFASGLPSSGGPFGGAARSYDAEGIAFAYPEGWNVYPGEDDSVADGAGHAVVAHLTNFDVSPPDRCTAFTHPCRFTRFSMPIGAVSVIVSEYATDGPPLGDEGVAEPVVDRSFGSTVMRWQLSTEADEDRWITVEAVIGVTGQRATDAETTVTEVVGSMTVDGRSLVPAASAGSGEAPAAPESEAPTTTVGAPSIPGS